MKKAQMSTWGVITKAIVVLFVAAILLFFFRGAFQKEGQVMDDALCGSDGDFDNDGIIDVIDSCLCENEKDCETPEGRSSCKLARDQRCKAQT